MHRLHWCYWSISLFHYFFCLIQFLNQSLIFPRWNLSRMVSPNLIILIALIFRGRLQLLRLAIDQYFIAKESIIIFYFMILVFMRQAFLILAILIIAIHVFLYWDLYIFIFLIENPTNQIPIPNRIHKLFQII